MQPPRDLRSSITLFAELRIELEGRDVTAELPGRQGRAVFACLALNWPRAVRRDELIHVLWPKNPPAAPEAAFSSVLAKLRRAVGLETISGRELLALQLPPGTELDVHEVTVQTERAETLLAAGDAAAALEAAQAAADVLSRPLLAGVQGDWVDEWRSHFDELAPRAFEVAARAGLALGGRHLAGAERAATVLVERERFREGAHVLLMEAQARRGDVAEALRTFDRLRVLLREELGTSPSTSVVTLHERLLRAGEAAAEPLPTTAGAMALPALAPRVTDGTFVGREDCLAELRSRWEKCRVAANEIVLVIGPAGIGKTRLAARFADEVHASGGTVLYGRVDEDVLAPYQPFVEALRHLLSHSDTHFSAETAREREILGRLLPDLGDHADAATVTATVDHETLRYRLFEAVAALLSRATRRWPVLLVLDDLQWADRPTLLLLRHLLRHPTLGRLLVLCTFRPVNGQSNDPLSDLQRELRRERRFTRLMLSGLDLEATAALVADRIGQAATPAFVCRLHEQTGGNAFFLEETLRAINESDGTSRDVVTEDDLYQVGVPEGVAEVILRHVGLLEPLAAELLTAVSVVGRDFPLAIAERLVDASPDDVIAALEQCIGARLLLEASEPPDMFTFSHALVREVLYDRLTSARRARLHHRIGQALETQLQRAPVNPAELARHFGLARHLAGREQVLRYTVLAGQHAADLFSYDEAVGYFRRALELAGDSDEAQRCELLLALGRVQWHAGDAAARQTFMAAADSARRRGAAEQLARAALGLGERYWETAYVGSRYGDLLEEAATMLGPEHSALRALVLARLAENLAFPGQHERSAGLSAEALAIARRLGDEDVLIATLLARHVARLDIRHLDERLAIGDELLRRAGDHRELSAERHQWRLYDLLEAGRVQAAREEHRELETIAAELRQPLFQTLAAGWRGVLAELAGDVELAERSAEECRRNGELAHAKDTLSTWAAKVFALRRRDGRLGELAPVTEELAAQRRPGWQTALGLLRAELGDTATARVIYDDLPKAGPEAIPRGMFWLVNVALLSELCATLEDADGAPALYSALAPYAHRCVVIGYSSCWGPVDRFLALLAETAGDHAAAARHALAALERTRAIGARLLEADLEARYPELVAV